MSVRWGLLSTARINRAIVAAARSSERASVVAVASRGADRASAYAREHAIERAHGSYEDLLSDPGVDAVYIALPNSLHVEWTLRALEAGKHVLCEKPLSRRVADVERVFDRAEELGLVVSEAFMWRHNPQTKKVAELVAGGAVGHVHLVRAAFSFPLRDSADVRLRPQLDGGALMDVGCYGVNGARLLGGEPVRVHGEQVRGPTGVDLAFAATLRFAGGAVALVDCAFLGPYRAGLEVAGDEGVLHVADPWHIAAPGIELRRGGDVERIDVAPADSYRLQLENLGAAIRGEAPPLLGREDAVGQARVLEALYESAA